MIYSQNVGMKFGIDKCTVHKIKRGKIQITEGIKQPNQEKIRRFGEKENYQYLRILGADIIKLAEME